MAARAIASDKWRLFEGEGEPEEAGASEAAVPATTPPSSTTSATLKPGKALASTAAATTAGTWRERLRLPEAPPPESAKPAGAPKSMGALKYHQGFSNPPLYQSPAIEFRARLKTRGGGRGFFANQDIPPGTLLVREAAAADIPFKPSNRDPAERCLLSLAGGKGMTLAQARSVLKDLELLHPQNLDTDVDPAQLEKLRVMYAGFAKEMKSLPRGKDLGLTDEKVLLRHVCALHFNGFTTGLYLHLAMVNHSCAPNCVKWGARDGAAFSELRSTRLIRAEEEITFSYLIPAVRSREARQRHLFGQFQFTCTCDLCERRPHSNFELLEEGPAPAAMALETELEDMERLDLINHGRAKEVYTRTSGARAQAARAGLGPRNLALAHADCLLAEACLSLMDETGKSGEVEVDESLVMALVRSAISLRRTQLLLFGSGVPKAVRPQALQLETRAEAEPSLQHIASGLGFLFHFARPLKARLATLKALSEGDDFQGLFAVEDDVVRCILECQKAAMRIADLYDDPDEVSA